MRLRSHPLALTLTATIVLAGLGVVTPPAASAAPDTGGLVLDGAGSALVTAETEAIAPGLDLTSFRRSQPNGWVTGHVLEADLSTPTLSMDVLDAGAVSGGATVTQQVAGTGAVAAVNGDYFDINASGAPVGTNVSSEGVRTIAASPRQSFTVADGVAAVRALGSAATVSIDGASVSVRAVNAPSLPAGALGWYTSAWGTHPLERPLGGPGTLPDPIARASVSGGVVTAVSNDPASVTTPTAIASGEGVLLGRGASAATVGALEVGDRVDVSVGVDADVDLAVGGSERLLTDGQPTELGTVDASRTAVGISRDGTTVWVVSIEGRQADAKGMTITDLGVFLRDLGAWNAVNLDGGGSSALLAREPGTRTATLVNRPSDGTERVVANSLAFFSSAPAGAVEGVRVEPALDREGADRVLPGLTRTITGVGLDAALAGVDVAGVFAARDAHTTVSSTDGATARVVGVDPGSASVSFQAGGRTGTLALRVLGELERVRPSSTVVPLPDPTSTATITLEGVDRDGFAAPIETSDVIVDAGSDVTVTPTGLGSFLVEPAVAEGAATLTFTVAGVSVDVAVTVGYRTSTVADFADGSKWTTAHANAPGGILSPTTGPNGEPALDLVYDYTRDTRTRGFYAIVPDALPGRVIEGQPQALTLWINGDGSGVWPRIQMVTGANTSINLDGPNVTWTGWQQARFTVPAGTQYPLTLQRIRLMETRAAASYQGHVQIAGLEAVVPSTIEQPLTQRVHDPVIVTDGTVDDRPQRIAVMSDSQFVARNPGSDIVAAARRTLREVVAADPDVLIINGDFVDEASPADFALARSILDEELADADFPFVYVPGNHEVMGAPIGNFESAFGATTHALRVGDTMLITLNSSSGSLRTSDAAQLRWLDDRLADAAADGGVTGVVVFAHHPADDPLPSKASQLGDRTEAAAFTARLAQFRTDTGKSIAAVNAHVGMFHATSTDGVSRLINGNSGKSPSSTPADGGFTGWTMLGIDPDAGVVGSEPETVEARLGWMQAETHARVDTLALNAPTVLEVGETANVAATVTQDGSREVPVAWPMSADWSGDGVVIDDAFASLERAAGVLRLNPATGEIRATGVGEATLTVAVNGVSRDVTITVVADPDAPAPDPGTDPADPGVQLPGGDLPGIGLPGVGLPTALAPSATPSARGTLPATGTELPWLLFASAGALLIAGGAGVMVARRRRNA